MSKNLLNIRLLLPALAWISNPGTARADVTKADNTTALNLPGSYTGGALPVATEKLLIDPTLTAARSAALGDNLSVSGISATAATPATFTINNTTGKSLTIGADGLNSSGTAGLVFNCPVSLGGNITLANTATGAVNFSALTLTTNQTWSLGGTSVSNRININGKLITDGNTLDVSAATGNFGILNITATNTVGGEVTFGTIGQVYVQGNATVTLNGTNNTNSAFSVFQGTANILVMGLRNQPGSIGKGNAYVRGGSTLNFMGGTEYSDKGLTRDTNGSATATDTSINVLLPGSTLTMAGNLTPGGGFPATVGGWKFGGEGNLTLLGNITNGTDTTVTKNGPGTLTLAGNNTYLGATLVNEGTLALEGGSQASPITILSGTTLAFSLNSPTTTSTNTINFEGADARVAISGTPAEAILFSTIMPSGITGTPVLSPAIPGYVLAIEGDGTVLKLKPASVQDYTSWAATNSVPTQASNLDHDHDGVPNGVEYFLGGPSGNTSGFTALPAILPGAPGAPSTITWRKSPDYAGTYNNGFVVETSQTLSIGGWTTAAVSATPSVPDTVHLSGDNVTYTFPVGSPAKKFARLKVTGP